MNGQSMPRFSDRQTVICAYGICGIKKKNNIDGTRTLCESVQQSSPPSLHKRFSISASHTFFKNMLKGLFCIRKFSFIYE